MFDKLNRERLRVTVRIWPVSSSLSYRKGSFISFGHVSLQTFVGSTNNQGYYISFWPKDDEGRCCGKNIDHFHTHEEDLLYCGQAPIQSTFTFYSLNPIAINHFYDCVRRDGIQYDLFGDMRKDVTARSPYRANCCSLVLELLNRANFSRISQVSWHSNYGDTRYRLYCAFGSDLGHMAFLCYLASDYILRHLYITNIMPEDILHLVKAAKEKEQLELSNPNPLPISPLGTI